MAKAPNAEKLVSARLRAHPEIAALVEDRVYTSIPNNATWPLIKVERIGGGPRFAQPYVLDQPVIQISAYGGPKATAWAIAEAVRDIAEDLTGRDNDGLVYRATPGTLRYVPDPTFDPAKPRYITTLTLTTRA